MCMYESLIPDLGIYIWYVNINKVDIQLIIKSRSFWRDVLVSWSELHFHTPCTVEEIYSQSLWLNSHIRIENKPCCHVTAFKAGVKFIRDIWSRDGLLPYSTFERTYPDSGLSWFEYVKICDAIPCDWKVLLRRVICDTGKTPLIEEIISKKKDCKYCLQPISEQK